MTSFDFVSAKTDGLGSRLKSLLIAMHLANQFAMSFSYRWQPKLGQYGKNFHSVETADSIFGSEFIRKGLIMEHEYNASNYCRFSRAEKVTPDAVGRLVLSGKKGVIVDALQPDQVLASSGSACFFSREFEAIDFSPVIATALEAASSVELPGDSVAIHVRGGDIIYGPFKHAMKHQDKAVPLPLIRDFTEQVLASGKTPILFMQDPVDRQFAADLDGVIFSEDLLCGRKFATSAARSLYDIRLMSRCSEIYSGSSRFSELASMLSGKPLRDVNKQYDDSAKFSIIERESRVACRYSPEHQGYAILSQLYCGIELHDDEKIKLLGRAGEADPRNGLYALLTVCLLMQRGDVALAEEYASKCIAGFTGKHAKPESISAEVLDASPFVYSFLRQAYSAASVKKHLGPFLADSLEGFPVLSVLSYHLRYMLGRADGAGLAEDPSADILGLPEVASFLSGLRQKEQRQLS